MESLKSSFVIKNPMLMYNNKKQQLDLIHERLNKGIINKVNKNKEKIEYLKSSYILNNPDILYKNHVIKLENLIEKLEIINPLGVLKRGYTLTYKNDKLVKNVDDVNGSVEAFSELIKKYKALSEQGVINVTEYIEKNAKAVNFYADRCNIELSKLAKGANVKDVLTAETVALDVIKNAKELLDNNYITTENYLTIRAKLLNAVIK